MEFGFYLPNSGEGAQPEALSSIAQLGDRLGFYCMVAPDHILMPREVNSVYPYSVTGSILAGGNSGAGEWPEQITTLAFLAGVTRRIRLVTSVMIVPYRNPLLTAKMLATLDLLSQGRLIVGAGVGWMREEFELLEAPPFAERGKVTDEYLQAFIELWTSENPSFDGEHVRFSGIIFQPKPAQRPHPPIWDRRAEPGCAAPRRPAGAGVAPGRRHPRRAAGAGGIGRKPGLPAPPGPTGRPRPGGN